MLTSVAAIAMKIGFLTPYYFPNVKGGGELSLKLLAEALVKQGHAVVVFSFDSLSLRPTVEVIEGVKIIRLKSVCSSALYLTLVMHVPIVMRLWEKNVDIYHIYNVSPLAGAGLYKIFNGKKRVVGTLNSYAAICPIGALVCNGRVCTIKHKSACLHSRHGYNMLFSVLYSVLFQRLISLSKKIDGYIALSQSVQCYYVLYGFNKNKIRVIHNFVETSLAAPNYPPYVIRRLNKKHFEILYVGTLSAEKGIGILLNAFSIVRKKYDNVHLTIVGSGRDFKKYALLTEKLSLDSSVTFAGQVSHVKLSEYYLNADLFIHPGVWPDPFPRTILEAMSYGVPLIVSNIGGPSEIIGAAGVSFKNGDVNDLSQKIIMLIEDDELKRKLSINSKSTLANFEKTRIMSSITRFYANLISLNPKSSVSENI